jgi:filamentous hemagglutinin family protein
MNTQQRLASYVALLGSMCLMGAASAQVVRDGTLGQNVPLGGDANNFIIDEIHGELRGVNLFHSFLQFDLSSTQTATFTGTSPINNVVSRVTGGPSTIAGLIRSDILGANIFLINPAGITFTDTAALDVTGSFHMTTADYLQFDDGERFFAAPGANSVLSPVDVSAFGFLGPAARISIQESILQVPVGETISVVGGDIDITGGAFGFFNAPAGQIHIASTASAGEIALDPAATDASSFAQLGSISLGNFAFFNVAFPGFDAGSIHLLGQNLDMLENTVLVADDGGLAYGGAFGGETGGLIDIDMRDVARVSGASLIDASGTFGGRIEIDAGMFILEGADTRLSIASLLENPLSGIQIVATGTVNSLLCPANICITDSAAIQSFHIDAGQGAGISLQGGDVFIGGNSTLQTTSFGPGTGGNIDINGDSVVIEFMDITADAQSLDGNTGSINISGNTIEIRDFAIVTTLVAGNGSAGEISLSGGDVLVTGNSLIGTQTFDPFSLGSPGSISIVAESLTLEQGSSITSDNLSAGTAGDIVIEVDALTIDSGGSILASASDPGLVALLGGPVGHGAGVNITTGTATVSNGGGIQTLTVGAGDAGNINLSATQSIAIQGIPGDPFATLISSGSLGALGNAGNITLDVPLGSFTLNDGAVISRSLNGSFGNAGSIALAATDINVTDGIVSTETDGTGSAGDLLINGGADTLASSALFANSVVGTSTTGSGAAGDMTFLVSDLTMSGGRMQARTAADGDAGNILIITDRLTLRDGAFLSNASEFSLDAEGNIVASTGGGGDLVIEASEFVTITGMVGDVRSTISNLNFDGTGERTLTIRTPVLTIEDGGAIEGSTFGSGDAAVINIDVQRLLVQSGGFIATDTSGALDLGGGLILPASTGAGGQVNISASESVLVAGSDSSLPDGTKISTSTLGEGAAGGINIDAPSIEVRDGAVVSAFTTSAANGGTINLDTNVLTITGNGFVVTDSAFVPGADPESITGQAGDIVVNAGRISLTGTSSGFTGVRSASSTAGDGGSVTVTADDLVMSENAQITARADGSGDAGDVTVTAGNITIDTGASIETRAAVGDGGNIAIGAGNLMYMNGGSITTSVESGVGSGGNITVDPRISVLDSSEIRADAFGGDGGNINLNSRYLIATPDSVISASSELGNAGVINVAAPDIAIVASLTSLPADFLAAATLFRPRCEVRQTDEGSSLVVVNRVGVPASPEGLLLAYDTPESLDGPSSTVAGGEQRQELMAALMATSEGSRALNSGQFDDAVANFEEASAMYAEAGDSAARDQALRSLSQAQQASGDYEGSVTTLNKLLATAEDSEDDAGIAQALSSLGNAYIALEQPERAREHLSRGITVAIAAEKPEIAALSLNNLANLEVTQGEYDDALGRYKESARLALKAGDRLQAAKALANGARVLLRANQLDATRDLLEEAKAELRPVEVTHDKVYVLIHISRTYQRLSQLDGGQRVDFRDAYVALEEASTLAEALQDDRALAYARGNMAELYELEGRYDDALVLTREAIAAAERAAAYESLYRWHWQTGRILWAAGDSYDALDAYRRAVAILQITRQETAYSYLREENSFRDSVGPVYRDLVNGLLRVAEESTGADANAKLLLEARDTVELFKAAELRDYFRDECVADLEARAVSIESVSSDAAIVYPVFFPERLELLVSTAGGLNRYTVPVGEARLNETIRQFRYALQQPASAAYLDPSQQLYQWLIAPYEDDLESTGISTLVFVPGGELRSVPMAALHDGRDFAIRKYALAVTPILALTDPQPLDRQDPRVLLAGISESVGGAAPLPYVPGELNAIQGLFGGRVLLDDGFTTNSFIQGMEDRELDIVHIASHGVFTGDPDKSFLLTHDGRISMNELSDHIGRTKFRETPLELLVLSACETAIGDDRAALGLAGVAINAGARSALGSLWAISDPATARLIEGFYTELQHPSLSRAEALRQAQLGMLDSGDAGFQHPYYWSAFLLISNWL